MTDTADKTSAAELLYQLANELSLSDRYEHPAVRKLIYRARIAAAHTAPATVGAGDGAEMIAAERERQKRVEGWTAKHDDAHKVGELLHAALCYAASFEEDRDLPPPDGWPWSPEWWKPRGHVRNLVKAGALIAAEIDRELRSARARSERSERLRVMRIESGQSLRGAAKSLGVTPREMSDLEHGRRDIPPSLWEVVRQWEDEHMDLTDGDRCERENDRPRSK